MTEEEQKRYDEWRDGLVGDYPHTLGEWRMGPDNEAYRGTHELPGVMALAEAGVKRMRAWLAKDMEWVDFALISAKRDRADLDTMAKSGEWSEDGKPPIQLKPLQRKLAAKGARQRHRDMQKLFGKLGYTHWITTVGTWTNAEGGTPEKEYGFFVPNAKVVKGAPKDAPLKEQVKPYKDSAAFKREMLAAGRAFTQQAVIVRTNGKTVLYNTFSKTEDAIQQMNSVVWGLVALKRMQQLLGTKGTTRPRATGDESEARFLMESCAFGRYDGRLGKWMGYSAHAGWLMP